MVGHGHRLRILRHADGVKSVVRQKYVGDPARVTGHVVYRAVVDRKADAFLRLGDDFAGQTVVGIGFDPDVLVSAGIEKASALAAVTNGDNSNIMIARVGRERFGIERVVARIYDPKRSEIYERLGIATVTRSAAAFLVCH
ncbi:MAG: hypothetical protein EB116_08315 [Betaproteobacteria bacterium]|nr:hypothetical protein [Betaproteobacteria bacterium]